MLSEAETSLIILSDRFCFPGVPLSSPADANAD